MAVGPQLGADGSIPASGRQGKTGEACVTQTHGKYYEAASRGVVFAAGDQGVGVTVQTSITTTGILSLHNPLNTGKRLSLLKLAISYFSGTLTAGSFYHGFNPTGTTLPTGGTSLTARSCDISYAGQSAAVGVASTGATVVAATVLYPFGSSLPILASTANNPFQILEDIDGLIVLEPGAVYQLVGVFGGAGSTPKISVGIVWEEVPIIGG